MTYRCCSRTHGPITPLIHKSILVSSSALWRFANTHLRTSTGRQGRGQSSITYLVIRNCWRKTSPFHAQHVPSGESCESSAVSWMPLIVLTGHKIVPILWKRSNSMQKDASSVPPDPDGKQQHRVEILNFVDAGTSTWLMAEARTDFHAETALEAVIGFLTRYGCPRCMTFDRASRWVGSHSLRHFPSAFCRFLLCLGIQPNVCPPRRPDKNAYVERLHRTLNQECLQICLPITLGEVREATAEFLQHYNHERPHQGKACGNRPPHTAFPNLPALPPLPERVNPDHWLETVHGQACVRKVGAQGSVDVDDEHDYSSQAYAGQQVVLFVNAPEKVFGVWLKGRVIKSVPIKGLGGQEMSWEE
jgi:hypothetical protein